MAFCPHIYLYHLSQCHLQGRLSTNNILSSPITVLLTTLILIAQRKLTTDKTLIAILYLATAIWQHTLIILAKVLHLLKPLGLTKLRRMVIPLILQCIENLADRPFFLMDSFFFLPFNPFFLCDFFSNIPRYLASSFLNPLIVSTSLALFTLRSACFCPFGILIVVRDMRDI